MIHDSPYNVDSLILKPKLGFLAGVITALVTLPVILILQPFSSLRLPHVLADIGILILPGTAKIQYLMTAGFIVHFTLGGFLGTLYSLCQVRAAKKGLIGVGIFYGIALWITSSLLTQWFYKESLGEIVHTWGWFVVAIAYGLFLALTTICLDYFRPRPSVVVPVD